MKFKVTRTHVSGVAVMMPTGEIIGVTDKNGVLETENEEHIKVLTTDVRYDYIEPVEGKRRAKSDAADSKDIQPQVQE